MKVALIVTYMCPNLLTHLCTSPHIPHRGEPTNKWTLEPSRDSSRAGVVCMDHFDMTGDGVRELIVGRDDGSVQIYSYDDGEEAAPTLRYTYVRIVVGGWVKFFIQYFLRL